MSIFLKKEQPEKKNLVQRIQAFMEDTTQFIKTTTGTITSICLLIGATSSLTIAIFPKITVRDTCSNEILADRHFNEDPIQTTPFVIKTSNVAVDMEINVYQNGDILTTYGTNRKWLCFPEIRLLPQTKIAIDSITNFLIPQVVAQTTTSPVPERTTYIQQQVIDSNNSRLIKQTRIYSNGTAVETIIDRKTGRIVEQKTSNITITPELREKLDRGVELEETTVIDVRN